MVVRVAQERQVEASLGQIDRVLRTLHDLDLFQAALLRNGGDVLEERRRDIHGANLPLRANTLGEEQGEQARPRTNVGDRHSGCHADRPDDLAAQGVDLARIALEFL